jgi:hypothetical protein
MAKLGQKRAGAVKEVPDLAVSVYEAFTVWF